MRPDLIETVLGRLAHQPFGDLMIPLTLGATSRRIIG